MKVTNPPANPPSDYLSVITNHHSLITVLVLALCLFALCSSLQAVTPAPDGGYPNGNTAEGQNALFSLTTGIDNTAAGFDALFHNTSGGNNTASGFEALFHNTTGASNTATGSLALTFTTTGHDNTANGFEALFSNTTGNSNTATGSQALVHNTTAVHNTATGSSALAANTIGQDNTAHGFQALFSNTAGNSNTATGSQALRNNTFGTKNTANGFEALRNNTTGSDNTANGFEALSRNTTGSDNTANGFEALSSNTTGIENTANGVKALLNNTSGGSNTAIGVNALTSNTNGPFNTAIGLGALEHNTIGESNTAVGSTALFNNTTGSDNIALGDDAGHGITGDNNIDIGNLGLAGESGTIRIGTAGAQESTFIAGVSGVAVAGGVGVIIDTTGHLGTVVSSERFKDEINPMDKASEAILALKPVTFRYKHELDPEGIPQFGLVAEDVEKVNPDLVVRDAKGKVYTVRYDAVNAMLLNEFLKEHRKVEQQEATIVQLKQDFQSKLAEQQKQIKVLTSGLEKVNNQLELNKPAPQMVAKNQ